MCGDWTCGAINVVLRAYQLQCPYIVVCGCGLSNRYTYIIVLLTYCCLDYYCQFEGENAALSCMNPYIQEAYGKFRYVMRSIALSFTVVHVCTCVSVGISSQRLLQSKQQKSDLELMSILM